MTLTESFDAGYRVALGRPRGWDAPHPGNWPHPHYFYAGMNAALARDGLTLSMFLRAIPQ